MKLRTRKPSRRELSIEVKMLEAERNRAIWERDRLHRSLTEVLGEIETHKVWTDELLHTAQWWVDEVFSRDGSATDAPKRSGTGGIWSHT